MSKNGIMPAAVRQLLTVTVLMLLQLVPMRATAEKLVIDTQAPQQSVTAASDYLISYDGKTLAEIRRIEDKQWQATLGHNFNKGPATTGFWFRVTLKNNSESSAERLLQIGRPSTNIVDVYVIKQDNKTESISEYHLGVWRPNVNKLINQQEILLPLSLPAHSEQSLYIYVNNHGGAAHYIMTLWQARAYNELTLQRDVINLMYLGSVFILALYNLFIFLSLRKVTYAFYVVYLFSFGYIMASLMGFSQWATGNASVLWHQYGFVISSTLVRLCLYLFTLFF